MNILEVIAASFDFVGVVLIAFTALRVHHRVLMEHRIDDKVFRIMKREQMVGFVGVAFVTTGFILQMIIFYQFSL